MSRPVPNPGILDIAPYTPGKKARCLRRAARCSSCRPMRRPFGPSPRAIEAYQKAAAHLHDYPEGTSRVLRESDRAAAFGLDPDRIICGAGSDETPQFARATLISARATKRSPPPTAFLVYPIATKANGAINVVASETDFHRRRRCDPKARVAAHPKLVLARQPEQPDRNVFAVRRDQAAARPDCRRMPLLVARRGLFRFTCRATITKWDSNWWRPTENTVMTHTFLEDSRPWPPYE